MNAMQMTQQEREAIITKLDEQCKERFKTIQELNQRFRKLNSSETTLEVMQIEFSQTNTIEQRIANISHTIQKLLLDYVNPPERDNNKLTVDQLLQRLDQTLPLDKNIFDLVNQENLRSNPMIHAINNELGPQIGTKLMLAAQKYIEKKFKPVQGKQ
jgi:hypothetical protein